MLRSTVRLYGSMLLIAWFWATAAGRPFLFFDPSKFGLLNTARGVLSGILSGVALVLLSRLLLTSFQWAERMLLWFASVLGPISTGQSLLLALFSAVGEEALFRGAMQPSLGIHLTSLLFAVCHFPIRPQLWPWTVFAGIVGYLFGWIVVSTGEVWGAVIAHFIVNFINLRFIGRVALLRGMGLGSEDSSSQNF